MRNKIMLGKNDKLYKTLSEKETYSYIVWATQTPKSNTNDILVPRLRTTSLLRANTDTEECLLCYHKSLTQLKET